MSDYGRSPAGQPSPAMSKAQQFEDEKRRIMNSCFSKQDTDGSLLESYITHCRVVEDASSTSLPPPLDSAPSNKKARVIFVAVRKSGRVRMHKARENTNGTFSIGKTWNLDDLQAITNHEPPYEKGFTVTIQKPYYWQANSTKEKDFFISSLLKIYKKYTGGKIPQLVGFSTQQLEAMLGPGGALLVPKTQQGGVEDGRRTADSQRSSGSTTVNTAQSVTSSRPGGSTVGSVGMARGQSTEGVRTAPKSTATPPPVPYGGQPPPGSQIPQPSSRRPSESSTRSAGPPSAGPPSAGLQSAGSSLRSPSHARIQEERERELRQKQSKETFRKDSEQSSSSRQNAMDALLGTKPAPTPSMEDLFGGGGEQAPASRQNAMDALMGNAPAPRQNALDALTGGRQSPAPQTRQNAMDALTGGRSSPAPHQNAMDALTGGRQSPAPRQNALDSLSGKHRPPPLEPPRARTPVEAPRARTPVDVSPLSTKKSEKDIASRFRLAANTYNAGSALKSPAYPPPRTPTTPTGFPKDLSRTPTSESLQRPSIDDRRPSNVSATSLGRKSEEHRRPSEDSRRPSYDASPRSMPKTSSEAPPPMPAALAIRGQPPAKKQEDAAPPQTEMRGRLSFSSDPMDPATFLMNESPPSPRQKGPPARLAPVSTQALTPLVKEPPRARSKSPAVKERNRPATSEYLQGLDRSSLTVDIDALLQEFKWDGRKKLDELKQDVKKELGRVESSNVVINLDHDDRVEQLAELLDQAIKECEEMDGLLTLYAVELTSLNDDIFHIENQSQGLQVKTANEKTLQKELETLLSTISISDQQLEALKQGSFESPQGLAQIEQTLTALYKALRTIDPDMTPTTLAIQFSPTGLEEGVGSMRALQERKEDYRVTVATFMQRLQQFSQAKFQSEFKELLRSSKAPEFTSSVKPHLQPHERAYESFWRISGLVAFARDIDADTYYELQRLYERPAKHVFHEEFKDHILAWKKITKLPTENDLEIVFNAPEKEIEHSAVAAARKLTVKKSIARIRGDSVSSREPPRPSGIIPAHEAFSGAFAEMFGLVSREQNFIVEFFQLSSQAAQDFLEFVSQGGGTPDSRRLGDLGGFKSVETDKVKAKAIWDFMNDVFGFLRGELQNLADWVVSLDAVQAVGMMSTLEQNRAKLDETNQEFLITLVEGLHKRLEDNFQRFLDEQVRAIEETKVKIKKRKGVVPFMRVFPLFAAKIESMIPTAPAYDRPAPNRPTPIRHIVNTAYQTLNASIFSSLHTIAKDTPTISSLDPDDKSSLNYHIMMIENMAHYLAAVPSLSSPALADFLARATAEYNEHLHLYTSSIIRRPVGKLLDFVTHVEHLLEKGEQPDTSHNRSALKKVLKENDGKEIRKGIDALRKRVEKHFEGENEVVEKVEAVLEEEFVRLHKRVQLLLVKGPYRDSGLELEFMVGDVRAGFKR